MISDNVTFEKVRDIICGQFDIDADSVTMDTSISGDLDADSLDLVDLAMSIEDEFDIEVPDEVTEKVKTVGDIVKFLEEN